MDIVKSLTMTVNIIKTNKQKTRKSTKHNKQKQTKHLQIIIINDKIKQPETPKNNNLNKKIK